METQTAYGFLHCHSEHSLKDSPLSIPEMCKCAAEMQAKAISLTDHGTCTGWIEFLKTCKKFGLNGIPGVEAYVETEYAPRAHLVLLAKNYKGYQEISGAITDANRNLDNVGGIMMPVMKKELLEKYFKNGNVIAMSACINGILGSVLLFNEEAEKKIVKLEEKIAETASPTDEAFLQNYKLVEELDKKINAQVTERDQLEKLASRSFKKRLQGLEILETTDKEAYLQAKEQLDAEIAESVQAQTRVEELKKQLKKDRTLRTNINQRVRKAKEQHEKYYKLDGQLRELKSRLIPEEELYQRTREELEWFSSLFSENFYIELQNHGLDSEKRVMPILVKLAREKNIPLVATNDVHIRDAAQVEARQFMKALRFDKWEDASPSDCTMYMKSDKELYQAILKVVDEDAAKESIYNIRNICNTCKVEFPQESHYPKYRDENGKEVEDTKALLRQKAIEGIQKRFPDGTFDKTYQERMEYELGVINQMGYADYLLIVADFVNYARNLSITNNEMGVGYGVGPGRGSGAGCLVNYLIGITNLDPLKYGLIFERFLNIDRVSMPDIDTDYAEEVRVATIEYAKQKYGEDAVAFIHTVMTQGAKAVVRNSARIRGFELYPGKNSDTKVSQKRKPLQYLGDTIAKEIPSVPGIKLSGCEDVLKKYEGNPEANVILRRAREVEGRMTTIGVHAAGVIIADGKPLKNYVPILYNTKMAQWAVQCDMVEAEEIGLLKMDFLGLKTLDIISECQRRVKARYGIALDFDNLKFEPEVFREVFSKGRTSCVFQFESGGMKKMLKEFQPESFEDIILLVAAYRPGPMNFIPDITAVKHGMKEPHYVIPQLEEILSSTYGYPIYQEQLMDIFHKCAGFTLGESDIIRRYMSKKKVEKFLAYKPQFIKGFMQAGASEKDAENTWKSLVDFANYAFNKSHAATYAVLAYITAYLKYHYPKEYMCAVMNWSDVKKLPFLLYECKEMGICVLPPDINKSYMKFTTDNEDNILYGLQYIGGVAMHADAIIKERQENGYYESFLDFLFRIHENKGVTEKLIKAGAFDVCDKLGRLQLLSVLVERIAQMKIMQKKYAIVNRITKELEVPMDEKTRKRIKKNLSNAYESVERAKIKLLEIAPKSTIIEDKLACLQEEYEVLGAYISGHPLESYLDVFKDSQITLINDNEVGKFLTYAGMVSHIRLAERKSDGAKMAFFTLEDTTGQIEVNCFTEPYKKYRSLIKEGAVVRIYGKVSKEDAFKDGEEPERKLTVKSIFKCHPEKPPIFLSVKNMEVYENSIRKKLLFFKEENGFPVYLHDSATGDISLLNYRLNADVLDTEMENAYIDELLSDKPNPQNRIDNMKDRE